MLDPALGRFDWVVAMDSIIHYRPADMAAMVERLAERAARGVAVTFAPRTPLLALMRLVGQAFPRGDRSPDLEPVAEATLRALLAARPGLGGFDLGRSERVDVGFYKSQSLELVRR
jgi:magnesium-protoporphyrin O-methyltransferase